MLALVVTIIVLLILAAITLSLAVGENGIIKRAKLARDKVKNASIAEEEAMNLAAGEIDNTESSGSGSRRNRGRNMSRHRGIRKYNKGITSTNSKFRRAA